ncbi:Enamine deaminase RidA, house cleaning of reactive enamine intermediates, YjgF/YER057c/UK114 family [Saccharopolyspora shandongensis]|uniref:Enamine deaminase RidA, house cleaning of reactive enamine intermediates, YjgF/YER057c/UK114 family n=1 Tax=Saccharopolyspora shandongensis TaxID=418495 RepID=A0A1H2QFD6_9PSEU|nr:RidA family protein [Saccharopolyspora shandongensis]SDW05119.1 Enamine deaminase RidA, house cleaning of reactive enamine intermediates, YjgF/YER057c/UK114 family [Saccharopolyspora shandongensis]
MIKRWNPEGVAPPIGRYSHLARVPAGHEYLIISGQVGTSPNGELAGPDAESQTRAALTNIENLLKAAGAELKHLVKLFAMLSSTDRLAGYRKALQEALTRWYPNEDWPTHSLIVVAALATPELAVEVEATAAIPAH